MFITFFSKIFYAVFGMANIQIFSIRLTRVK